MIVEEIQNNLIFRYSDKDVQLHKVGTDEYYDSVYDIIGSSNQYEESDRLIGAEDAEHPTDIEGEVDEI